MTIRTDNGPAYVSTSTQKYFQLWEIKHKVKIPYNLQGQVIIKRPKTLKQQLAKQKEGIPSLV